jgi:hypothetical protein
MITPLYGQLSPLHVPTTMRFISNDADVVAYVLAVEAADGQRLEDGVISAYDSFITGCKSDGIWSAIKASCILAGARTLSGALVPLVGTAPTPISFVSGDYNRKTGLVGNATTKKLNTNRNNNLDPQNSKHAYTWLTERIPSATVNGTRPIGTDSSAGGTFFGVGTGTPPVGVFHRANSASTASVLPANANTGSHGVSRSNSANYAVISAGIIATQSAASATPLNQNIFVFGGLNGGNVAARISFYSTGEGLSLALLDSRVSNLMTAFALAIP